MVEPVRIGRATLYLGDARELVEHLQADVIISDPPYGNATVLGMGGGEKGDGGMWADVGIVCDDDLSVRDEVLFAAALPFAVLASVRQPQRPRGTVATLVWDKGEHVGAGDLSLPWKPNVELIHVAGRGWQTPDRRQGSVLRINAVAGCVGTRNDGKRWHPFEKPLQLMEHLIERAPPGVVLDPFMGSATTGVACLKLGREFIGIESQPEFFALACERLRAAAGNAGPLFGEAA